MTLGETMHTTVQRVLNKSILVLFISFPSLHALNVGIPFAATLRRRITMFVAHDNLSTERCAKHGVSSVD